MFPMDPILHFFRTHYSGNVSSNFIEYAELPYFCDLDNKFKTLLWNVLPPMDNIMAVQIYQFIIQNENMDDHMLAIHIWAKIYQFVVQNEIMYDHTLAIRIWEHIQIEASTDTTNVSLH